LCKNHPAVLLEDSAKLYFRTRGAVALAGAHTERTACPPGNAGAAASPSRSQVSRVFTPNSEAHRHLVHWAQAGEASFAAAQGARPRGCAGAAECG
jgi:hypothetical protein